MAINTNLSLNQNRALLGGAPTGGASLRPGLQGLGLKVQAGPTFVTGGPARTRGFRSIDPATGAPPTGLAGSENAILTSADKALAVLRNARNLGVQGLRQSLEESTAAIGSGRDRGTGFIEQGIERFNPLATQGTQASDIQAALSGALGVEAQQQAIANLSPVNEFLQEQGSRAVTRNAAAFGGLGSGNVQKELTRFGQGLAEQSAQQQFANLGTVADRGFNALQNIGNLRGRQGDIALQAGLGIGNVTARAGQDILGARLGAGRDIASVFTGTGGQVASGRTRAGEQLASSIGSTTSALSGLVGQQGQGLSSIAGATGSNIAGLLSGAGQQAGASNEQLAGILANLAVQQGSQVAGLPALGGFVQPDTSQQTTANLLGALGTLAQNIG